MTTYRERFRQSFWSVVGNGLAAVGAVCALGVAHYAAAAPVSEPVGAVRFVVPGHGTKLVCCPFDPLDRSLADVLEAQLTPGAGGDMAVKWDAARQDYLTVLPRERGKGAKNKQGKAADAPGKHGLRAGEPFWIVNGGAEAKSVCVLGKVILDDSRTVKLLRGMNLVGAPFTGTLGLDSAALAECGAQAGGDAESADLVTDPDTDQSGWLLHDPGHPNHGRWVKSNRELSRLALGLGAGRWYRRRGKAALEWVEHRPYADSLGRDARSPRIVEMALGETPGSVVLGIATSGEPGERLEVLCQDVPADGGFNPQGPWRVLAEDLRAGGEATVRWCDTTFAEGVDAGAGGVARGRLRVYVACRQDVDADDDGLSDAQEGLVWRSDPRSGDSDDDGMPDKWEAHSGLNLTEDDALDDPDGDGYANALEHEYDTHPTADPMPPQVFLISPAEDLVTNAKKLKLKVRVRGGPVPQRFISMLRRANPLAKPPQIGVVTDLDLILKGRLVRRRPHKALLPSGLTHLELDLEDQPEGVHELRIAAVWKRRNPNRVGPNGQSKMRRITIDRTAPPAPDLTQMTLEGGTLLEGGIVEIAGRDVTLSVPVDADANWALFDATPRLPCLVRHNAWQIEDGVLTATLRGVRMGTTPLKLTLLDKAANRTETKLLIKRVAPAQEGGDAE